MVGMVVVLLSVEEVVSAAATVVELEVPDDIALPLVVPVPAVVVLVSALAIGARCALVSGVFEMMPRSAVAPLLTVEFASPV